jgi:hypothetical protein
MKIRSIKTRLLLTILLGGIAIVASCWIGIVISKNQNVEDVGANAARELAAQIVTLRNLYSDEIVTRTKAAGINFNNDFDNKNALPAPETFVKKMEEQIFSSNHGAIVRIYGQGLFNSMGVQADEFEQQALKQFESDPNSREMHKLVNYNGQLSMRYVIPDTMQHS